MLHHVILESEFKPSHIGWAVRGHCAAPTEQEAIERILSDDEIWRSRGYKVILSKPHIGKPFLRFSSYYG